MVNLMKKIFGEGARCRGPAPFPKPHPDPIGRRGRVIVTNYLISLLSNTKKGEMSRE
jgi:hypothetical protein